MIRPPFPFKDFQRAKDHLRLALCDHEETYLLLTGDTGCGKTALLRELRSELDRTRYRVLYFSEARRLGATGLIKVVGEALRVRSSMCHAVNLDRLLRALAEEAPRVLIWLDEAHELPEETLAEVRALAESDLDGRHQVQILLAGLPRLRSEIQASPALWRRIVVREEITGLLLDELQDFLDHHFASGAGHRLSEDGLALLFERARGAPGLLIPMYRAILAKAGPSKAKVDPHDVEQILERWDLA